MRQANIVQGDALDDDPVRPPSRSPSPSGVTWARASSSAATSGSTRSRSCRRSARSTLFGDLGEHDIFIPTQTYPPMTVGEIAR